VLLPVALLCVWAGGYAFLLLVAAACVAAVAEWGLLCGYADALHPSAFLMMVVIGAAAVCGATQAPAVGLLLVAIGTVAAAIWGDRGIDPAVSDPARLRIDLAMGIPYLGLAAIALPWLRADPLVGLANTIFTLVIVWASDIGAYMIGRLAGGAKLAPAISPGKTWSGAVGGLVSAALAGLAAAACLSPGYSPSHVIGLAIVLGIISQAGDLLESALKRHFGVKDSGSIIPGHGGLLDRLDALLAVAPVAALLAFTAGPGVVLWR
jgi:phosphatidate cytidylyltransferase